MKSFLSIAFSFCFLISSASLQADTGRPFLLTPGKILLNTSGTVFSIGSAWKTSNTSGATRVEVFVTKTGGRAETDVNVAIQTQTPGLPPLTTVKKSYTFENGNYTRTKRFVLFMAKDKKIVVTLNNKSVTNTFKYTLLVKELN